MIEGLLRDGLIAETQGDYRLGDGAQKIEDADCVSTAQQGRSGLGLAA
jgi:major membrane immunogen (membrane-anchored lipoprotein)